MGVGLACGHDVTVGLVLVRTYLPAIHYRYRL